MAQRSLDLLGKRNEKFLKLRKALTHLDCGVRCNAKSKTNRNNKRTKKRKRSLEGGEEDKHAADTEKAAEEEEEEEVITKWTHLDYTHNFDVLTDIIPGNPHWRPHYRY
ncbi:hypothetical protein EG329_000032 [Mollisiaceae sp. DMI_Dod_QoI]|nr:hypothetical protein EG329_000032 [Helotiales sp. DMI_Dod_QoI]